MAATHRAISLPIILIVYSLFVAGCRTQPKLVGGQSIKASTAERKPILLYERVGDTRIETLYQQSAALGQPLFPDGPNPLSGRIVVKIDPKEVLYRYNLPDIGKVDFRSRIPEMERMPQDFEIKDATEIGSALGGRKLIRIELSKPMDLKKAQRLLSGSPIILREDLIQQYVERHQTLVIETPRDLLADIAVRSFIRRCPQLRHESELNVVFDRLRVRSIRRVFPMVESRVDSRTVTVTPMLKLVKASIKRYPVRAGRAPREVEIPENMENWFLLHIDAPDLRDALDVLRATPGIRQATLDYPIVTHQAPSDEPDFASQWALQSSTSWGIDAQPAWNVTPTSERVVVAVVDRGIKEDLAEFTGRLWTNPGEIPGNGTDDDDNNYIDDVTGITVADQAPGAPPMQVGTHGIMVAALIAANSVNGVRIAGVAGEANVKLMNVSLGPAPGCSGAGEGVLYAALNGADIVNMSWGSWPSAPLWEAIQTGNVSSPS